MNIEPKVTIIIPCHNRDKFIAETLDCVLKTNYTNWECIVVDNSSTDLSAEIIQKFQTKDKRIKYIFLSENNISVSRNTAIKHSSGIYILPLDSDDLIHPNYVREAADILTQNPGIKIVTCNASYFGKKIGRWNFPAYSNFDDFLVTNCLHNTSMYRRADFDRTGGYDPELIVAEEWDFWISILKDGGIVHTIEKEYFFYRRHSDSTYKKYNLTTVIEDAYKLIYNKHKELYVNLLNNPILLLKQNKKYKEGYNKYRTFTFRKPIS
ncbi:MAG: glycosyltransferase family 2 protein [Paludibacteraceae bacterium]